MTPRKGTITENGIKINWQQTAEGVSYADGKMAKPSPDNMDAKIAYKTAISAPIVVEPVATIGNGSGSLRIEDNGNTKLKIKPGIYSYLMFKNLKNVIVDATGVIVKGSAIDIEQTDGLELFGLSITDSSYRAVNINGYSNALNLHDMGIKNIKNYTICYRNPMIYNGTDSTVSKDWIFERISFENTGQILDCGGGLGKDFGDDGIQNLMRNFKFLNNTIKNCPDMGQGIYVGAVEGYEIAYNTIDNVNTATNNHNGIFHMLGNGSCHHNKLTNHQGNLIRAWLLNFGTAKNEVLLYNNTVYNSRKYSALELQLPPHLKAYMDKYPQRIRPANAKVFNNTAGHLNTSNDWHGQMLDLYDTAGTIEYYNNLGFDMKRFTSNQKTVSTGITDMIALSGENITKNENNKYFPTATEAVEDIINFKSKFQGIGAQ